MWCRFPLSLRWGKGSFVAYHFLDSVCCIITCVCSCALALLRSVSLSLSACVCLCLCLCVSVCVTASVFPVYLICRCLSLPQNILLSWNIGADTFRLQLVVSNTSMYAICDRKHSTYVTLAWIPETNTPIRIPTPIQYDIRIPWAENISIFPPARTVIVAAKNQCLCQQIEVRVEYQTQCGKIVALCVSLTSRPAKWSLDSNSAQRVFIIAGSSAQELAFWLSMQWTDHMVDKREIQ